MTDHTCSIDGCDMKRTSRGWCRKHYIRWIRNGDPLAGRTFEGEPRAHFDKHIMTMTDECKIWPFYCDPNGYGELRIAGKKHAVHVLACIAWHGDRPEGMEAAHGPCHNPSCWNGAHLSWSTPTENQRDKVRDGTDCRGVKHPRAKLTEVDVAAIRYRSTRGETSIAIARDYPVHHGTIRAIITRRIWRHIP